MTRTEDLDPPLSCHFGFITSLNMYSIQVFILQPPIHGNVTRRVQVKFVVTQNRQSQCTCELFTREFGSTMALNNSNSSNSAPVLQLWKWVSILYCWADGLHQYSGALIAQIKAWFTKMFKPNQ
jgi:hypothetical protein